MQLMKSIILTGILTVIVSANAWAKEPLVYTPQTGSLDGAPEFAPGVDTNTPAGSPYYETLHYSAYAKRTYVPGYVPKKTSLFENPRTMPDIAGHLKKPYSPVDNLPGYHFSSPRGYRTGTQAGSPALDYFQGRHGITANLGKGYPDGLRVIEPAIVPMESRVEEGGIYIKGGGLNTLQLGAEADYSNSGHSAPLMPYQPAPQHYYPATIEK